LAWKFPHHLILAGYLRDDPRNNESALKYFLLGSFATAFHLRNRVDLA
jgi:NADH:ubiquinone oxidoreductase subunit 2 (subunit N)